jgi:flavorubredoxin
MTDTFGARKVADNVYWVGAIDWDVRNFHGYLTSRGTTYNAFLVLADRPTLIDVVKAPFLDEMMARVASVIEPERIEYIVSNHSEMDHSGCLPQAIAAIGPQKVFASKMGRKALSSHFHMDAEVTVVGDGDSLDLGNMKLSFAETPMCHWPDSMVTYLHESRLLFSQDAFGMHLAGYERFADELDGSVLDYEAAKYFANILMHLSRSIRKALDKVAGLGLPIDMVAPDHGPIWRTERDIQRIIGAYGRWADQEPTGKAVVVYDTMWQSTAKMARAIGDGLADSGATVKLMSMSSCHRSDVATELLEAGALVVGSPTMNNNIFPTVADVMTYIKGLSPRNLVGAAFGSYGWGGQAPKQLHAMLEEMGVETVADPMAVCYVPDADALARCREMGRAVGKRLMEKLDARP